MFLLDWDAVYWLRRSCPFFQARSRTKRSNLSAHKIHKKQEVVCLRIRNWTVSNEVNHECTRIDTIVGVLAGYSIEIFILPGHFRNLSMRHLIPNLIRVYSCPFVVLLFQGVGKPHISALQINPLYLMKVEAASPPLSTRQGCLVYIFIVYEGGTASWRIVPFLQTYSNAIQTCRRNPFLYWLGKTIGL